MPLLWNFFNRYIVVFFETSVLKEVRILCYLYSNSVVLILMLSSEKSYPILFLYMLEKHSYVADFFSNVFYTLYFFNCSILFFIKLFLFLWKSQSKFESMFLHNTVELLEITFLFIKGEFSYIKKVRTKLHIKSIHIKITQHDDANFDVLIQKKPRKTKKRFF